jgi:hypothetical protein
MQRGAFAKLATEEVRESLFESTRRNVAHYSGDFSRDSAWHARCTRFRVHET